MKLYLLEDSAFGDEPHIDRALIVAHSESMAIETYGLCAKENKLPNYAHRTVIISTLGDSPHLAMKPRFSNGGNHVLMLDIWRPPAKVDKSAQVAPVTKPDAKAAKPSPQPLTQKKFTHEDR